MNTDITSKDQLLQLLNESRAITSAFFDLSEADLERDYGQGKWNIRQILHHLADAECVFHSRFKRIIAEPKQVIWSFDQEDWESAFNYKTEPLTGKKDLYLICRDQNYLLVDKYYDSHGAKEFVHSINGLFTLRYELARVGTHNAKHIGHMQMALGQN